MFTSAKILIVWSVFLILCQCAEEKKNMNVPECIYNMDDYLFVFFVINLNLQPFKIIITLQFKT